MEQELEFILRDIVDDLKRLRADHLTRQNESGIIIQHVEAVERLLKEQKPPVAPAINLKPVEELVTKELLQVKHLITANTINKQIEHKHHLHKGLLISFVLMLLCFALSFGWYNSYDTSKKLRANDIKYRALKVVGGKSLLKLLHYTDSVYLMDSDSFEVKVKAREKKQLTNR